MDHFLAPVDDLSRLIEGQAQILYRKLSELPVQELGLPEWPLRYYLAKHYHRRFFSVQTAAELLYRSIKRKGKKVEEITIVDYGAGMGSLFLLAKMIGCKAVVYNDIEGDMVTAAGIISKYLEIPLDLFVSGDENDTVRLMKEAGLACDIIVSRNVIEHIYDLGDFFNTLRTGMPEALVYFSTTANIHNPAMHWVHKRIHRKAEQTYLDKRRELIGQRIPGIEDQELQRLAAATRGLAMNHFDQAVVQYQQSKSLPDPWIHRTNTCDPENGLWAEHLLPVAEYRGIIEAQGYRLTVLPAFWDTHYGSSIKNVVGKTMNWLTRLLGDKNGLKTTAFIYIVAEKKP